MIYVKNVNVGYLHNKMYKLLAFIFLVYFQNLLYAEGNIDNSYLQNWINPISFINEIVWIKIKQNQVEIDANFIIRNDSSIKKNCGLRFPFYIDSQQKFPAKIDIWEIYKNKQNKPVIFFQQGNNIFCFISMEGQSEKCLNYKFVQNISGRSYKYIVTTLKEWGNVINKATFIISTLNSLDELKFSYPIAKTFKKNGIDYYYIDQKNFIPNKELEIQW